MNDPNYTLVTLQLLDLEGRIHHDNFLYDAGWRCGYEGQHAMEREGYAPVEAVLKGLWWRPIDPNIEEEVDREARSVIDGFDKHDRYRYMYSPSFQAEVADNVLRSDAGQRAAREMWDEMQAHFGELRADYTQLEMRVAAMLPHDLSFIATASTKVAPKWKDTPEGFIVGFDPEAPGARAVRDHADHITRAAMTAALGIPKELLTGKVTYAASADAVKQIERAVDRHCRAILGPPTTALMNVAEKRDMLKTFSQPPISTIKDPYRERTIVVDDMSGDDILADARRK